MIPASVSIDSRRSVDPLRREHLNLGGSGPSGATIDVTSKYLEFDGRPWMPATGEFHFSRYPFAQWDEELARIKAGGISVVATYIFWIHHEEVEGEFDWSGSRDLGRFVRLCASHGLSVLLRVGPFAHGECRNGGLPDWLFGQPFPLRCNDPRYLKKAERLYREIGQQVQGLMFRDGGPVVGVQIENEFMSSAAPWETTHFPDSEWCSPGADGIGHMMELKKLAKAAGMDVPLWTCTGWGSPVPPGEFIPCYGGYAFYAWMDPNVSQDPSPFYVFRTRTTREAASGMPSNSDFDLASVPYATCEIGGGMTPFYRNRPIVPPRSVEAMVITFLGSGANWPGIYVYHGGRNPAGHHSYLNEYRLPRVSYDYGAPLGEWGQARPHYDLLRRIFLLCRFWGGQLAPTDAIEPKDVVQPGDTESLRVAVRVAEGRGWVFLNNFQDHLDLPRRPGISVSVELEKEALRFPSAGGFDLEPEMSVIWPLNLDLAGVLLKSATLQPLARLDLEGVPHFMFFSRGEGKHAGCEYAFEPTTDAAGAETGPDSLRVVIPEPGLDSTFRARSAAGAEVAVTTLTDAQSCKFYLEDAAASRAWVLLQDEASMCFLPGGPVVYSRGNPVVEFAAAPPLPKSPACVPQGREGVWTRYRAECPPSRAEITMERIGARKMAIRVTGADPAHLRQLFLRVQYRGDIAMAFYRGKLVADHFYDGRPWEIGLLDYLEAGETEIVLRVSPKPQDPLSQNSAMAAIIIETEPGEEAGLLESVELVPEYRMEL